MCPLLIHIRGISGSSLILKWLPDSNKFPFLHPLGKECGDETLVPINVCLVWFIRAILLLRLTLKIHIEVLWLSSRHVPTYMVGMWENTPFLDLWGSSITHSSYCSPFYVTWLCNIPETELLLWITGCKCRKRWLLIIILLTNTRSYSMFWSAALPLTPSQTCSPPRQVRP